MKNTVSWCLIKGVSIRRYLCTGLRLNKGIVTRRLPWLISEINGIEWGQVSLSQHIPLIKSCQLVFCIKLSLELWANPCPLPLWLYEHADFVGGGQEQLSWGEHKKRQEQLRRVTTVALKRHHLTDYWTDSLSLRILKHSSQRKSWPVGEEDP